MALSFCNLHMATYLKAEPEVVHPQILRLDLWDVHGGFANFGELE